MVVREKEGKERFEGMETEMKAALEKLEKVEGEKEALKVQTDAALKEKLGGYNFISLYSSGNIKNDGFLPVSHVFIIVHLQIVQLIFPVSQFLNFSPFCGLYKFNPYKSIT